MSGTSQIVAVLITAAVLLVSASTTNEPSILANRDGEMRTAVESGLYSDADASLFAGDGPPQAVESRSTPDKSNPIRRINFNDIDLTRLLKVEEISPEQVEGIPNAVTEFDGKFVTIEGFMYPAFRDTELTQFILVEQLFF